MTGTAGHGLTLPKKRPYDDDFLIDYSREHVAYEIEMFLGLAAAREAATIAYDSSALATLVQNAILEAVVLHFRNLVEFLYGDDTRQPRSTDVVAPDYFSDPSWVDVRPPMTDALRLARRRADKEMAHLTTERLDPTDRRKAWDTARLRGALLPAIETFLGRALRSRLDPAAPCALTSWMSG